jgi:hypothetical protein
VELQGSSCDMRLAPDEAEIGSFSLHYLPVHGPRPGGDNNGYVVRTSATARKVGDLVWKSVAPPYFSYICPCEIRDTCAQ